MTVSPATARAFAALAVAVALAGCVGDAKPGAKPGASPAASSTAVPRQTLPARWWAWVGRAPQGRNPVSDTTGEFCAEGQPSDVFFLAGTFGRTGFERTCTVPAGKPVYFPLLNRICPVQDGESDAGALDRCVMAGQAGATLDGKAVASQEQTSGGHFRFVPALGNALSDYAGNVVAWGIWAGPLTLAPGEHTLVISARSGDFAVGVTYALTVG